MHWKLKPKQNSKNSKSTVQEDWKEARALTFTNDTTVYTEQLEDLQINRGGKPQEDVKGKETDSSLQVPERTQGTPIPRETHSTLGLQTVR